MTGVDVPTCDPDTLRFDTVIDILDWLVAASVVAVVASGSGSKEWCTYVFVLDGD